SVEICRSQGVRTASTSGVVGTWFRVGG
ncbi:hypothetical protein A2U01_0057625, partial [Trifolium medium]|nr:hypothetical protein [Trifolium medium]